MYKKYNFKDLILFDIYLNCIHLASNLILDRYEFYLNIDLGALKFVNYNFKYLKEFNFNKAFSRLVNLHFIKLENDDIDFIVNFQLLYFVLFIFTLKKK